MADQVREETSQIVEKRFNMLAEFKEVKAASDGYIYVEGYASTFGNVDLDGEVVAPDAFNDTLDEYKMNPIILANHNNTVESVVGQTVDAKIDQTGLWVRVKLSNAQDEFTSMVRQKVQEGILRAFSIGGLFQYEYPVIKRVKLLEISIVPIPANSYALFSMAKAWKGLDIEERNQKTVGGADDLPLADRNQTWDGSAAQKRIFDWAGGDNFDPAKARRAFFWYDSQNQNNKTAYKLPFADVIGGELKAVPKAIFAVAAALQGARGGVDIPQSDIDGIKKKVAHYYERMRKEFNDDSLMAPWEKAASLDVEGADHEESGQKGLEEPAESTSGGPAKQEETTKEPTIHDYYQTLVQVYKERGGFLS